MAKTVLVEQTSKRLKRWELIVTTMLFLTLGGRFRTALCGDSGSGCGVVADGRVLVGVYSCENFVLVEV